MFEIDNNSDYKAMVEAYTKNGAGTANTFSGQVRGGGGATLNKGDVIEWPKEYKVLLIKMRENQKPAEAVIVKVTGADNAVRYQPFFPSSLGKLIYPCDFDNEDKLVKRLAPIRPEGTAAKFYQSKANLDVDTVMKELMAKGNIKVTDMKAIDVCAYQSTNKSVTYQYTFDFVA